VQIKTTSIFTKNFKKLFKKDRNLLTEYEELLNKLESNPILGTNIGNGTYKIRLQNKSNNKGKSGGYRIVTYTKIEDTILLVHIYSKSDIENIHENIINEIIENNK
jgi:mRNA-degrading endonuclease RelE of RelBE toxin-antitoxin system